MWFIENEAEGFVCTYRGLRPEDDLDEMDISDVFCLYL